MRTTTFLPISSLKIACLSGLGGMLEFYDFILYIIFSDQIAQAFFTAVQSPAMKNFLVVATFSAAYISRPIGGIIAGWLGDTQGRKISFSTTIFVMGICVFLMGIMPSYSTIGITATFLFILLRLVQGLALGGELPSAIVFIFESVDYKRGFALGIMFGIVLTGFLFGNVMSIVFRYLFTDLAWRAAFISGSVVAVFSYYIRSRLQETSLFVAIQKKEMFPCKTVLCDYSRNTIGAIFCVVIVAFYGVIISLYLPKYLTMHVHYDLLHINHLMIFSFVINITATLFVAWLSDYIDYRKLFKRIACGMMIVSYPALYMINQHNDTLLTIGILSLALFPSMATGIFMRIICESFPTAIRLSGVAIAYNIAFAVVGSAAPLSIELLIHLMDPLTAPAIISVFCAVLGYISIILLEHKPIYKN